MVDFVSKDKRSRIMRGSKSKDTKPELAVRRALRQRGVGYRLHLKRLPGSPDIAMLGRKKAIFVHGCFWHQHSDEDCRVARLPASNMNFWSAKFERNRERDTANESALRNAGFDVLTIWECQIVDGSFEQVLTDFLSV